MGPYDPLRQIDVISLINMFMTRQDKETPFLGLKCTQNGQKMYTKYTHNVHTITFLINNDTEIIPNHNSTNKNQQVNTFTNYL